MLIFHEGLLNCSRILCVSEFEFVSASVNAVFQCIWQRERDREKKKDNERVCVFMIVYVSLLVPATVHRCLLKHVGPTNGHKWTIVCVFVGGQRDQVVTIA
jgi:hypothetical protein